MHVYVNNIDCLKTQLRQYKGRIVLKIISNNRWCINILGINKSLKKGTHATFDKTRIFLVTVHSKRRIERSKCFDFIFKCSTSCAEFQWLAIFISSRTSSLRDVFPYL